MGTSGQTTRFTGLRWHHVGSTFRPTRSRLLAMGLLTFSINVTLDGCVDHREGIADDETHAFFTRLMDEAGAMLWGRVTYEMMEGYWPAVARGDEEAPPARWWLLVHGKSVRVDDTTYF